MILLGKVDLLERWTYTRQGVHKVLTKKDFPEPWVSADFGRTVAWRICDIEKYEKANSGLLDPVLKRKQPRISRKKKQAETSQKMMQSNALYLGKRDLFERWTYTRQGVRNVLGWADAPQPAFVFNNGRGQVWHIGDIEVFETAHKELINAGLKQAKQRWFAVYCSTGMYIKNP